MKPQRVFFQLALASVCRADLFSFSVVAPMLTLVDEGADEGNVVDVHEESSSSFFDIGILQFDPLLSSPVTNSLRVTKPYMRSERKKRVEEVPPIQTTNETILVSDEPLPDEVVDALEVSETIRDPEPATCESAWPSVLKAGESLDTHSYLETCSWVNEEPNSGATTTEGKSCVCAHATVERLLENQGVATAAIEDKGSSQSELPPLAHFVVKAGRAPVSPLGQRYSFAEKNAPSIGDTLSLLWSSAGQLSRTLSARKEEVEPQDRLFFALRSDGNLLLSRQVPNLKRREVIWESSSGGELHNRYYVQLRYVIPQPNPSATNAAADSRITVVEGSPAANNEKNIELFAFEVIEILGEADGSIQGERIIYSSSEGDVSVERSEPEDLLAGLTPDEDSSSQPLESVRRVLRGIFNRH